MSAFILLAIAVCAYVDEEETPPPSTQYPLVVSTAPAAFNTSKQGEKWLLKQVKNIQQQYEVGLKAMLSEYQRSGEASFKECDTPVAILD